MKHLTELYEQALKDYDEQLAINEEHKKINGELRKQNEFLMERDNKCQILEQRIKEAIEILKSYAKIDVTEYEKIIEMYKKLNKTLIGENND